MDAELCAAATGRRESFFVSAMRTCEASLREVLTGKRVLVVGAGGSIGSETSLALAEFELGALHLTDISENYLADLMRHMRNREGALREIRSTVVDYGNLIMRRFLSDETPFDIILNFAAHKHVRGERDGISLLSMLDTNAVKHMRFKGWLAEFGHGRSYFAVSTDKAADPSSVMGASKRLMEDIAFDVFTSAGAQRVTSARFANVAYSNGSLLSSILQRIARGEPVACPRDTRRYFLSLQEAGQLCLLAATLGPEGSIMVPDLDSEKHLVLLETVAARIMRLHGLTPVLVESEREAFDLCRGGRADRYPLLLTPLDTGGEKAYEIFVASDEQLMRDTGIAGLNRVAHHSLCNVASVTSEIEHIISGHGPTHDVADHIVELLRCHVRTLPERREAASLDERI